jgi:hypothetical protein
MLQNMYSRVELPSFFMSSSNLLLGCTLALFQFVLELGLPSFLIGGAGPRGKIPLLAILRPNMHEKQFFWLLFPIGLCNS